MSHRHGPDRLTTMPLELIYMLIGPFFKSVDLQTLNALFNTNQQLRALVAPFLERYRVQVTAAWPEQDSVADHVLPAQWAAYHGNLEVLRDLLSRPDFRSNWCLANAYGYNDKLKRVPYPSSPLAYAVLGNQLETVRLLLKAGERITYGPVLRQGKRIDEVYLAVMLRRVEILELILSEHHGVEFALNYRIFNYMHGNCHLKCRLAYKHSTIPLGFMASLSRG